jgi:hypothetical protein
MKSDPVDAVITWVDGNTKAHTSKRAKHLAKMGKVSQEASAATRFNQCGEISYCVKSILRFAPWIRTIFIVTDAQTPSIMKELMGTPFAQKIKLIDHRDIFQGYEHCLPTFNSVTIESMLWRINGLSEKFIYFNDDIFLLRAVRYEDFFKDDKLVLRGQWRLLSEYKWRKVWKQITKFIFNKKSDVSIQNFFQIIQENAARLVGWTKYYFHLSHAPLPAKKKNFEDFFQTQPAIFLENLGHPFRDNSQFMPFLLAQGLEINQKKAIFDKHLKAVYINCTYHPLTKIQRRLLAADKKNVAFLCTQSMDLASESTQTMLFDWLKQRT